MKPNFTPTVITNPEAIRGYSLEHLFDRWRLAEQRRKAWSAPHFHNEPFAVAYTINYERLLTMLYQEVEDRAERMSTETLMLLIQTGSGFFTDNLYNPKE